MLVAGDGCGPNVRSFKGILQDRNTALTSDEIGAPVTLGPVKRSQLVGTNRKGIEGTYGKLHGSKTSFLNSLQWWGWSLAKRCTVECLELAGFEALYQLL